MLVAGIALTAVSVNAQGPVDRTELELLEALADCREIETDGDRLACFDQATNGLTTPRPSRLQRDRQSRPLTDSVVRDATSHGDQAPAQTAGKKPAIAAHENRRKTAGQAKGQISRSVPSRTEPTRAELEAAFGTDNMPVQDDHPAKTELDELKSMVVSTRRNSEGKLLITLANGQVWRQTQAEFFPLDTRDGAQEVVIFRGLLGSYILRKADENRRMRVRRIR